MIRISEALSCERVATYFKGDYTIGDYYTADRVGGTGTWQGRGAERLGLAGDVSPDDFFALLRGQSPRDGCQLVAAETGSGKHRAAWDVQAAPDKSVSLVALVGGDRRVIDAHLTAARRALAELEEHALVKDRKRRPVASRNLVIARFDHDSSRALDPHLHSHHVVFNLTERAGRRSGHGEWRALEPRDLFAEQLHVTAIYQAELARELQALGYEVRADAQGLVRIAGISEEVIESFSKRRRQILDEVARRGGAGNYADRQRAALYTRAPKRHDIDPAELRAAWRDEAARNGLDLDRLRRAADARRAAGAGVSAADALAQARASVAWAADHHT
ncbi:MAG TPA: MobF family relaxase, partial [Thermoanaerobaculia bacterium]